jgi:hypothetical protein
LIIQQLFRDEGDVEYDMLSGQWYLLYDVILCIVWLIETSLTMVQTWIVDIEQSNKCSWFLIILWIFALYATIDSIIRINKKVHGNDHTSDMMIDVVINFLMYGYIVIAQYIEERRRHNHDDNKQRDYSIANDYTNDNYHYNTTTTNSGTLLPSYQLS